MDGVVVARAGCRRQRLRADRAGVGARRLAGTAVRVSARARTRGDDQRRRTHARLVRHPRRQPRQPRRRSRRGAVDPPGGSADRARSRARGAALAGSAGGLLAGRRDCAGRGVASQPAAGRPGRAVGVPADDRTRGERHHRAGDRAAVVHGPRRARSRRALCRRGIQCRRPAPARFFHRVAPLSDAALGVRGGGRRPRRVVDAAVHGRLMTQSAAEQARASEPWLPDLCRLPRLATMFGVAELVVLVLALAPDGGARWNPQRFVSASGFALWLALTIAVLLCASRRQVSRLPVALGSLVAVAGAAFVAVLGAAMLHQLDRSLGYHLVPASVHLVQFALGSGAIAALITAVVLRYLYVIDGWQAQVRASARAEIDALQARIKPHFLFNSMNTIAGLVRHDPVVAERAVLDLSDLFRAALDAGESDSTLAEEVELAERYLSIEALRLGPRLQVAWRRTEPLPWRQPLPRLVLQPLVENAVLHGVSRRPQGGTIEIDIVADGGVLRLAVRNPAPPPREGDGSCGAQHAQRSIGHRLAYAFGPRAGMTAAWDAGYYRCELKVPITGERALNDA